MTLKCLMEISIILKEDQPIVGKIGDWETESLDYSVMEVK